MVAGPEVRNAFLLGGMMRIVYHVADQYLPPKARNLALADGPGLRDWVTAADVGRLPAPAVGDYITRSSMPMGSFAY
jgi:hypothetical protein